MTDYTADDYAEACKALALGEKTLVSDSSFADNITWTDSAPPTFGWAKKYRWRAAPKPPKTKKLYPYAYQVANGVWRHGGWVIDPNDERLCGVKINADGTIDAPEDL